jgi:(S)-3,5-dihydroxyphenylglycine transaminase
MSGPAQSLGITTVAIPSDDYGLNPETVEQFSCKASCKGRVRALYDIPDFNNPLGTYMPIARRRNLLEVCTKYDVFIIDDNPYGMFLYDGDKLPTLKALDQNQTVLSIGSFSKTLFPGLRLGFLVARTNLSKHNICLAEELSQVKSLLTVNMPGISQGSVANILLNEQGSLKALVRPQVAHQSQCKDALHVGGCAINGTQRKKSDRRSLE